MKYFFSSLIVFSLSSSIYSQHQYYNLDAPILKWVYFSQMPKEAPSDAQGRLLWGLLKLDKQVVIESLNAGASLTGFGFLASPLTDLEPLCSLPDVSSVSTAYAQKEASIIAVLWPHSYRTTLLKPFKKASKSGTLTTKIARAAGVGEIARLISVHTPEKFKKFIATGGQAWLEIFELLLQRGLEFERGVCSNEDDGCLEFFKSITEYTPECEEQIVWWSKVLSLIATYSPLFMESLAIDREGLEQKWRFDLAHNERAR